MQKQEGLFLVRIELRG
ncbi:Protein of unknown function [Bacillus cereus]|uniref:Uncharacterized protein n=1 Tax=Bacillus thuringiensis TaxID=1428 RepID=A0A1C4DUR7_BACTU|nr:Protein of unknown function [Bacillus cereus]SCC35134.1 Protein of unknown function [Bacillus thuringiensis]SCN03897.1 Protein of unknown function [Bacillus wiedmannii]SCN08109.1 Protein of unknown function [Bacillus wiedmannii]SCN34389.1 Protein of unknown function [Bacillus wiedmannii]